MDSSGTSEPRSLPPDSSSDEDEESSKLSSSSSSVAFNANLVILSKNLLFWKEKEKERANETPERRILAVPISHARFPSGAMGMPPL